MLITDPVADMLIRIKNALLARKNEVKMPHSKLKEQLAKILVDKQYVGSFEVLKKEPQSELLIKLRYVDKDAAITGVKQLSKPGRRVYAPSDQIPNCLNGYGITIVSTSKGIMVGKEARKNNVGGELICQVW